MTDLAELLERVKAATGPDRELDARIYVHLIARLKMPALDQLIAERAASHPGCNVWLDGARDWQVKPYTASLDAALALVERCGWRAHSADASIIGRWSWMVESDAHDEADYASGQAPTPALALILALLRALQAQAPADVGSAYPAKEV